MRKLILLLFIFQCLDIYCQVQNGTKLMTPNFPKPYKSQLSERYEICVKKGEGVAVVFEQFLASNDDCVIACPLDNNGCSSICGDAMDHGLIAKILRIPGNAIITMVSIQKNDGFPHSGISGKIIPYDLQKKSFFNCGDSVNLSTAETYYLISQNYPNSPDMDFQNCTIEFNSDEKRKGIRFVFYDFYLTNSADNFVVKSEGNEINFSGFLTEDEPVVKYFTNSARVIFSISKFASFIKKRFYIIVNSYEEEQSKQECSNIGNYLLNVGDSVSFGTNNFGSQEYSNNLECKFDFNISTNHNNFAALAIEYESEKCCDTMSITGLSQYEEIYQGFQYSNLFLSRSNSMSFSFQSDSIIGGTGLNATIQNIDCSCPSDIILNSDNQIFTSPGFDKFMTYCPSLNCITKIHFDYMNYDLNLELLTLNLRNYFIYNSTDSMTIFDSYNHQRVRFIPGFIFMKNYLVTTSPVIFQFQSTNLTYFPLANVGKGVKMNMKPEKKKYLSTTHVLNNTNFILDISNLNFQSNNDTTFEFRIFGRDGHKISVYFFTKISYNIFVDILDGMNSTSSLIDNKELYSNIQEDGYSIYLQTTQQNAIVRIRANTGVMNENVDFQAMITDYDVKEECGSLVYNLQNKKSSDKLELRGDNCLKILHYTDSSYNPNSYMNVQFYQKLNLQLFIGLKTNQNNMLINNTSQVLPKYIFAQYLTLKYSTNDTANLDFKWDTTGSLIAQTMNPNETISIMTSDYCNQKSSPTNQEFEIELIAESNWQTGINIETNNHGFVNIKWLEYEKIVHQESVTQNGKKVYEYCGNKLKLDYNSNGENRGLYAKIRRADLQCSSSMHTSLFLVIVMTHVFL